LNNASKRMAIFNWLNKSKFDVILLQETHTCLELESAWNREWQGPVFLSHGSSNRSL